MTAPTAPAPLAPATDRPRPFATDARPWEPVNTDTRLNHSSYKVQAGAGMIAAAHDLLVARTPGVLPNPSEVVAVAKGLLHMADKVQSNTTGAPANRMVGSHTRARGFLHTTLNVVGLPDADAGPAAKIEWAAKVCDHATALFRGAVHIVTV